MHSNSNIILKTSNSGISYIKLNDPNTYNSLSLSMLTSLIEAFKNFNEDDKTKVVIIEGAGKGFSAGHNLKEIKSLKGKPEYKKLFNLCSELMMIILNNKKPVIAKVHGAAYAAGCQLVASCDLAYSTKDALFATPGVNIGLFCSTPMVALSRNVSKKNAMKMLLTGDMIDAAEAKRISLINEYVSADKLNDSVMSLAKKIATKPLSVVKIGKDAFYRQSEMSLTEAYEYTSKVMTENSLSDVSKEGIASFLEKRDPLWTED